MTHNVFQEILKKGYDDDFIPQECFVPTDALPGSFEKIEVFRQRLEQGVELFCSRDVVGMSTIEQTKHMQEIVTKLGQERRKQSKLDYLARLAQGKADKRHTKTNYISMSKQAMRKLVEQQT